MIYDIPPRIWTNDLHDKYLVSYHCATRICKYECQIWDIAQTFIPISDIMSDSALFSPISDVPISGSVRYRWSRISDWVPTYAGCVSHLSRQQHFHPHPGGGVGWQWGVGGKPLNRAKIRSRQKCGRLFANCRPYRPLSIFAFTKDVGF